MSKNRSALTIKRTVSPQAVFRVTPKIIFDDVDLYTVKGVDVNILRNLFCLAAFALFDDPLGLAPRCGGGYITMVPSL